MAIVTCKECGDEVSTRGKTCPRCGAPITAGLTVAKVLIPIIIVFSIWLLAEEESKRVATVDHQQSAVDNQRARDSLLLVKGQESVRSALKDPESAKFGQIYLNKNKDGLSAVCGEVNSKNSYGGYVGPQRFISSGLPDTTFLENDPRITAPVFQDLWARLCKK